MQRPDELIDGHPTEHSPAAPAISLRELSVAYHGHTVLADVSLDMRPAAVTALVGPSGCGKTSLLNCLNRMTDLIAGCTTRGQATIGGEDVFDSRLDVVDLRRRVGMIFQKPNPLPMSIHRNLDLPLAEHRAGNRAVRDAIIEQSLRDVGLWDEVRDRLNKSAMSLSGGQQQRLCLARALALRPDVLLLDEPCSALDPLAAGVVEELIQRLRERYTIVMVTHNLAQARRIADDVAVLWTVDGVGRLIEHGPAEKIFADPQQDITRQYVAGRLG